MPDFATLGEFSLLGSFERVGVVSALLLVFTLMLADFFDTMGTMTAIGAEAGLLDEDGTPPNTQRILIVDSVAAAAGGAAGVSSNTSYIESAVRRRRRRPHRPRLGGHRRAVPVLDAARAARQHHPQRGGRPGAGPGRLPDDAAGQGIDWDDLEIAIPAFLTIVLMPFTYSITVGIGAGFLAYVLIKVVRGKAAEVHLLMWIVAAMFVVYFAIEPITALLT